MDHFYCTIEKSGGTKWSRLLNCGSTRATWSHSLFIALLKEWRGLTLRGIHATVALSHRPRLNVQNHGIIPVISWEARHGGSDTSGKGDMKG